MNRHVPEMITEKQMRVHVRLSRRMLTAVGIAAGSAGGLALLSGSVLDLLQQGVRTPDAAVAAALQLVGLALLVWYLITSLVALGCLAARAAGRVWTAGECRVSALGAPVARRLLVSGAGAMVAAATVLTPAVAAPAIQAPAPAELVSSVADDLGWGAMDDDAGGTEPSPQPIPEPEPGTAEPTSDPEPEPTPQAEPASSTAPDRSTYTVAPGDSLWDIAAEHLPNDAAPTDIAAAWPRWFEHNRDVVGANPDLIHPGQVLLVPQHHPEEEA